MDSAIFKEGELFFTSAKRLKLSRFAGEIAVTIHEFQTVNTILLVT